MAKGFDDVVAVIKVAPLHVLIGRKCAINGVIARIWLLSGRIWDYHLVEEPENGVYPSELEVVAKRLKGVCSRHSLVLIITYSPYLLDFFMPAEVSLCVMDEQGEVSLHRLSESDVVKEQSKVFTLGEIWAAEGDDALMRKGEEVI